MDLPIVRILSLDGATNGAIYALLGLAIVLVFSVTRIIFIPQGEFVAFGALSLAMLQIGQVPGTVWLLLSMAVLAALLDGWGAWRAQRSGRAFLAAAARTVWLPAAIAGLVVWAAPRQFPLGVQALLAVALVAACGPLIYRLAYQSLADASALVLLIVSVGVHFVLTGLGLLFFGAEGFRNPSFWDARIHLGGLTVQGQVVIILGVSLAMMGLLWQYFARTLRGKALQATAVNRLGARLMGISTVGAGRQTFTMAALLGALSGLLIGPTTTIFYDSGFLIGLKGFVAAVIGGLESYPLAAIGAIFVGLVESFGSFWASAFKEVIVFTLVLPILFWRSLASGHSEEH